MEDKTQELDLSMEEAGFSRIDSLEETLKKSNKAIPIEEIDIDSLSFKERQAYYLKLAKKTSFLPIPKKQNGCWFRLKREDKQTILLMLTDDGEKLPTGIRWDK